METPEEFKWAAVETELDAGQLRALASDTPRGKRSRLATHDEAIAAVEALANQQSIEDVKQLQWPAIEINFMAADGTGFCLPHSP